MGEAQSRTVQLGPMSVRADLGPRSINDESRTVDLIITTTAGVRRRDWSSGKEFLEVLSMDPAHIRLDRINGGAPLLDSHSAWSVADILGTVVPGSVSLTKKAMLGTVRFSKRAAVEPIWQDVKDGIVRDVSVGYRVYAYEAQASKRENELPTWKAIDWEPYEASMVPVPADSGAKVRSGESAETYPCEVRALSAPEPEPVQTPDPPAKETRSMTDRLSDTIVQPNPLAPAAAPAAPAPPAEPNERDAGVAQERARVQGIHTACRAARMPVAFEEKLIADGIKLVDAQARVFEELGRRDVNAPREGSGPGPDVRVGDDPLVHVRSGIAEALLHRFHPAASVRQPNGQSVEVGFKLTDLGRQYRGMTLLRIAEAYIAARGVRTTGMSKWDIVSVALGFDMARGGMHTAADFPLLLADVASKLLRQAYQEAPQTFMPLVRVVYLPDFKMANRVQLGEAPALAEVLDHGEVTAGTIGEGREQFQLRSYARKFAITRRALINDDTDAFARVPIMFGRSARNLESDLVWAQGFTANPVMGDTVALFNAAGHGNDAAVASVIDVANLGLARGLMRAQTGLDGVTRLNLAPRYLIVPASRETVAQQMTNSTMVPALPGSVNPFAGALQVICEARLDGASLTAWYLAADPTQIDLIELAYLEGENGPRVESRVGFDVEGVEIKCGHDVAAKAMDWRGFVRNTGV
jgi:hypothetical protein